MPPTIGTVIRPIAPEQVPATHAICSSPEERMCLASGDDVEQIARVLAFGLDHNF